MLLKDYIPNVDKKYRRVFFSGISSDSTNVKKDNIFFAIKGNKFDGNNYIDKAIKNGAKVIVSEKKIIKSNNNIVFLYSSNVRKLLANVSYKILDKRPKKIIAVTGTNGKSSIADFYYQILSLNSKKVASIGTIGIKHEGAKKTLTNTTLDPIQLSSILKDLKKKKIDYIILEASSHGLKQNRLDGLLFNIGIFTNLSHDHLDYHKNFKEYFRAKQYLFENLIGKKGNVITDETLPEFKRIKKIAISRKLKLQVLNNSKNQFQILSHSYRGEKQILKIRYYVIYHR